MFFGIVQILLGLLFSGMALLFLLSQAVVRHIGGAAHQPLRLVCHAFAMYVGISACLLILGAGSMQCRRWARALTLVINWIVLIVGVALTLILAKFLPRLLLAASASGRRPLPPGAVLFVSVFAVGFTALFAVLLPLIFVLFYSRASVRSTCERCDPVTRWTDKVPLTVLAMVVLCIWGAYKSLAQAVFLHTVPVFGTYVSGLAGAAVCLGFTLVLALLAFGFYRRALLAWWTVLIGNIVAVVSFLTTLAHSGLAELYRQLGISGRGIDLIVAHQAKAESLMTIGVLCAAAAGTIYLLIIHHHFGAPPRLPAELAPLQPVEETPEEPQA